MSGRGEGRRRKEKWNTAGAYTFAGRKDSRFRSFNNRLRRVVPLTKQHPSVAVASNVRPVRLRPVRRPPNAELSAPVSLQAGWPAGRRARDKKWRFSSRQSVNSPGLGATLWPNSLGRALDPVGPRQQSMRKLLAASSNRCACLPRVAACAA